MDAQLLATAVMTHWLEVTNRRNTWITGFAVLAISAHLGLRYASGASAMTFNLPLYLLFIFGAIPLSLIEYKMAPCVTSTSARLSSATS
jgi:hypothetical protein